MYLKINASRELFKNLYNDENPFPYQFIKIWPLLGYYACNEAKRSLLNTLQENIDFVISNNADKSFNFDQNDDDTEIIYLSRIGDASPDPWKTGRLSFTGDHSGRLSRNHTYFSRFIYLEGGTIHQCRTGYRWLI